MSLFKRASSPRCAERCKMQTHCLQPLAESCITSLVSRSFCSPQTGIHRNKLILCTHQFQCSVFFTVLLSVQVFKLLDDIRVLSKGFQKISSIKQEITALKKALCDTMNFLESNQSIITHWFSKVSIWWTTCKQTVQASTNAVSHLTFDLMCPVMM